jgi:hypothetical protein
MRALITRWDRAVENGNPWAILGLLVLCAVGFVAVVLFEFVAQVLHPASSKAEDLQFVPVRHGRPPGLPRS